MTICHQSTTSTTASRSVFLKGKIGKTVIYSIGLMSLFLQMVPSRADIRVKGLALNIGYKLPTQCSTLQCVIFAITKACEYAESMGFSSKNIAIYTDSQVAISALSSCIIKSLTVGECSQKLKAICSINSVTLIWVPGHSEVEGNTISDLLAKQGASLHPSYLINIPTPISTAKTELQEMVIDNWNESWHIDLPI